MTLPIRVIQAVLLAFVAFFVALSSIAAFGTLYNEITYEPKPTHHKEVAKHEKPKHAKGTRKTTRRGPKKQGNEPPKTTRIHQEPKKTRQQTHKLNEATRYLFARLVRAETRGEPYAGKVAVAEVVLNRTTSAEFPDNVRDVILQDGQFQPVSNGSIYEMRVTDEALNAIKDAEDAKRTNVLYFVNPNIETTNWIERTQERAYRIGSHVFYK